MSLTAIPTATDFSSGGDHALQRACHLAAEHGAALTALHVVTTTEDGEQAWLPPELALPEGNVAELQDLLNERISALCPHAPPLHTAVRRGRPCELITAAAEKVDLIVVGAHGAHRWMDGLVGSTAERVLHRARQPVLMVRRPPQDAYRRVVIATDFSAYSARALAAAAQLAPQAELHLLHVHHAWYTYRLRASPEHTTVPEGALHALEQAAQAPLQTLLQRAGVDAARVRLHLRFGHPAAEISAFAAALDADLVAGGTHGYSHAAGILLGSTSAALLRAAESDMLLCP
jgi:nucleotide-binding universal stress UspA family protein